MKIAKGENGYLKFNKRKNGIMAVGLLCCIFSLSVLGRLVWEKYFIYFAVAAALMILPAGQSLTQYLLFSKYKEGSKENFQKFQAISDHLVVLCDLIMVKSKKTVFLSFAVLTDEEIIVCYKPNKNKARQNELKADAAKHLLHEIIKPKGYSYHLEMFDDEEKLAEYIKKSVKGKLNAVDDIKQNKLATILLQNAV